MINQEHLQLIERINSRTRWIIELSQDNPRHHDLLVIYGSKDKAMVAQLDIFDALCKDHLMLRGKL